MDFEIFLKQSKIACFTDLHLGVHTDSTKWYDIAHEWSKWFSQQLHERDIRDIIFTGDLFHTRRDTTVFAQAAASYILNQLKDFNIIMIPGNHDCAYRDKADIHSLALIRGWRNVTVIDKVITTTLFGKQVTFCPWGTTLDEIPKCDIVFGHFEIESFRYNAFKVCSHGMKSSELLSKAPLIITGHFHLREERNYSNGKILYLGNPFQMDFGDIDSTKGYYTLDFSNLSYEFFENTVSPKHFKFTLSELVKQGKLTDETKSQITKNFIKLIIDKNISSDEIDLLLKKLNALQPIEIIIDYAFNFNKFQISDEKGLDLSGVDIITAIEEFVKILEIPFKREVIDYTIDLYKRCH